MDVFRSALDETVHGVIKCATAEALAAPPAAAAPASAFLQHHDQQAAPGPAAPGGAEPNPAIFVTFSPATEIGRARSVNVEITFTDTPENGVDDVALAHKILEYALEQGSLTNELKRTLEIVTGIRPKFGKVKMELVNVAAWDVKKCEGHIQRIVKQFQVYYTRERVPQALFNECTNFMTRLSFSHDYVLDSRDTAMCKETTAKFAEHWNFGQGTPAPAAPAGPAAPAPAVAAPPAPAASAAPGAPGAAEDFEALCVRACEAKFGLEAPQCNTHFGDALLGKPLFIQWS